jgi:hypothetical protein
MQIAELTKNELRERIHCAFDGVPMPEQVEEMLMEPYKNSEDAHEMAKAFFGKPWTSVPTLDLFRHREMLMTLSAVAYRAYLPAYLMACLETEDWLDKHGADIRGYLVSGLRVWPHQNELTAQTTPERLSLLQPAQRAVVACVLRYLETRWRMKEAGEVLREWQANSSQ